MTQQNNLTPQINLTQMELSDAYIIFLEAEGPLGKIANFFYRNVYGEDTRIAHVAVLLKVEDEYFVADYGVTGLTFHQWSEEYADKLVYSASLGQVGYFYPQWIQSVLMVLLETNARVNYIDFIRYLMGDKRAMLCTGFAELMMGVSVTNPTPAKLREQLADLPHINTLY